MILYCSFEELASATAATRLIASSAGSDGQPIMAPPEAHVDVEYLAPLLVGDIEISTLHQQRRIQRALAFLASELSQRMDAAIISQHPAAEDAVLAYFDYAHVRGLLHRVTAIGSEMEAIIELATGSPVDDAVAASFTFGD